MFVSANISTDSTSFTSSFNRRNVWGKVLREEYDFLWTVFLNFPRYIEKQKQCNEFINLSLIRMNILKVGMYASTQQFRKCLGETSMIT